MSVAEGRAPKELGLDAIEIEPHRAAEQHVEVLEGNVAGVGVLEPCERFMRQAGAAAPLDAFEIGVEIDVHVPPR